MTPHKYILHSSLEAFISWLERSLTGVQNAEGLGTRRGGEVGGQGKEEREKGLSTEQEL